MNKKNFETVDQLLSVIKPIKNIYHSCNEYIEIDSLWPLVSKPGVMHSSTKKVIELAFDHGGYIAGGFGRWAATSNKQVIERGEYVACGGDIDLFFNTQENWASFVKCIDTHKLNDSLIHSMTTSIGNLAVDFTVKKQKNEHRYNAPPKMQAIGCLTGTPIQIMRTFDFVNCMFAITRENTYAANNALNLEKEKVLGISSWSNTNLVHRLTKYRNKYGFIKCRDLSENKRIEHLCYASNVINNNFDLNKSSKWVSHWMSFIQNINNAFFEDSNILYDILTCIIIPFDINGRLASSFIQKIQNKNKEIYSNYDSNFEHLIQQSDGIYKIGLSNLIAREKKAQSSYDEYRVALANLIADTSHYCDEYSGYSQLHHIDDPLWTAEQYCWSV